MKNIGKKAKVGILYNTGARMAGAWLQLFHTIFLARLLTPEDFGMVATGMLVIGFATKFGEFGFNMGLIQRQQEVTDKHVNTLFTMDITFKLVLWLIVFIATRQIAAFFDGLDYNGLVTSLPVLSFYMVLECFSTTPMAMMQRQMDFKNRSVILISERIFETILAIVLAFMGFGFWSLIYSKLVGILIVGVWAAYMMRWMPKFAYDREAAKELFNFGFLVFLRNLFRYGADNAAFFVVLKFIGGHALGIYEKAFNIMRLPQKRITKGMNSVVFSAFSRIQDDPERVRIAFRKIVLAVSLVSFPVLIAMAVIAPYFVPVLLGDQWLEMIVPLQIMCLAGITYSIDPFLNTVLTATGFVKFTVYRRLIEFILIGIAAYIGVSYGINGVAIATLIVFIIIMLVMVAMITSKSKIGWGDYFGPTVPATITTFAMTAFMYGAEYLLENYLPVPDFLMLIILTIVSVVSYIGLHFLIRFPLVVKLTEELRSDSKTAGGVIAKKMRKLRKFFMNIFGKKAAV